MLQEKINKDYIQAMKGKDQMKASTLSFLRAQIKNVMIEQKADQLKDPDIIAVIKKQVKQRQDSIEQFEKGGRADLSKKENQELVILKEYLPKEISDGELKSLIDEAIEEAQAQSIKDMGNVMKVAMGKIAGRADNRKLSQFVKDKLSQM